MQTHADYDGFMKRCIELAHLTDPGVYGVRVGVLIADHNGNIISEGTKRFNPSNGQLYHAEHVALLEAGDMADGATLVTTLEPCVHRINSMYPSCADLILFYGIKRAVIGRKDGNPKVNGGGIGRLSTSIDVFLYPGFEEEIFQLFNRQPRTP